MKCQTCGINEAKVTISALVDGHLVQEILCGDCAKVRDKTELTTLFSEEGLLNHLMDVMDDSALKIKHVMSLRCPNCGLTYAGYKKIRKIGCAVCYTTFEDKLREWIKRFHGSDVHIGIRPNQIQDTEKLTHKSLRNALKTAVEKEDYEAAVILRDLIKASKDVTDGE